MNQYAHYIPHTSTTVWIIIGLVILFKLNYFLTIFKEVISEKSPEGKVGPASIKRFIPLVFTFLICYMVVGHMRAPSTKAFNDTAFWGLILFISIATTVITWTQANTLLDKISLFKGKGGGISRSEEVTVNKKTEEVIAAPEQPPS